MNDQQRQQVSINAYTGELKLLISELAQRSADLRAQLELALLKIKELEEAKEPKDKPALKPVA